MTSASQRNTPRKNAGILSYHWSEDEIEAWKKLLKPNEPTGWRKWVRKIRS